MKHKAPTDPITARSLLSLQKVAGMLSISRETLYRRIREGLFPEPIKQGRRSYFSPSDVDAYLSKLKRLHG